MKKNDCIFSLKNVVRELEFKKNYFFFHRINKYIIDYHMTDDYLIVESNLGITRKVKNTSHNINKLNKIIVKNKIAIAQQIDDYEDNIRERSFLIVIVLFLLCGCGCIVPMTLFMGSYVVFLLSIVLFSLSVIVTSLIGLDYYIKSKEVQNLKRITGYKLEKKLDMSKIELPKLKKETIKDAN